ncbi:MAG TPA: hypothetical protein VHQ42_04785 [Candidatus Limnocylindria bacterium]|nr:hypothetical protein [Candidatus Limnocylindria bacterium]
MDDKRANAETTERSGSLAGADAAAMGMEPPPESAPPGAEVSDAEHLVPGADFGTQVADEEKPWFTSLAAESEQAGVMNEPLDPEEDIDRG